MTAIDERRREALIGDVARQFRAMTPQQKATLLVAASDLYFAVQQLTRFEQLSTR